MKVVCGDWSRVCGGNWQSEKGVCGIFFDPPYSAEAGRDDNIYHKESSTVAQDVARWAAERAQDNRYRIVLAGYYNEHEWLLGERWSCHQWSATGGYANQSKVKNENRHKEALFLSPHCLSKRLL